MSSQTLTKVAAPEVAAPLPIVPWRRPGLTTLRPTLRVSGAGSR
jgi:hypothetical protein